MHCNANKFTMRIRMGAVRVPRRDRVTEREFAYVRRFRGFLYIYGIDYAICLTGFSI